ncbi:hypothetical protein HF313_16670 [Massilia atriviolacea]|uniref:hypothetical protein n=1 Tax=Massilia atriviolacea TaxID=2495579 RepID=UPI003857C57F
MSDQTDQNRQNRQNDTPGAGPALTFDDFALPQLAVGSYTVEVEHQLHLAGEARLGARHAFTVSGPRYRLAPDAVHARMPQDGEQGELTGMLPHVVLRDAHSAWLTRIDGAADPELPGMALLVCEEHELLFPAASADPAADLRHRRWGGSQRSFWNLLANTPGLVGPALTPSPAERDGDDPCQHIRLLPRDFGALLPRQCDLRWSAHVRRAGADEYCVVQALRLPAPAAPGTQRRYIAHLVSLEGWGHLLAGAPGAEAALAQHQARAEQLCMLSLAAWTFTSGPAQDGRTPFVALAHGLLEQDGRARDLRLLPPQAAAAAALGDPGLAARLGDGFVPLPHTTWGGERLLAWYRGPLVAVGSAAAPPRRLWEQFSDALVVDARDHVLDASHCAAWYLGRNLSLADRPLMQAWFSVLKRMRHSALRLAARPHAGAGRLHAQLFPAAPALCASVLTPELLADVPQRLRQPARPAPLRAAPALTAGAGARRRGRAGRGRGGAGRTAGRRARHHRRRPGRHAAPGNAAFRRPGAARRHAAARKPARVPGRSPVATGPARRRPLAGPAPQHRPGHLRSLARAPVARRARAPAGDGGDAGRAST